VFDKEINMFIYGVFDLDIGLGINTTSCETFLKKDAILIVIVGVALYKDNAVAKSLGLGQYCRKSLV
jgi:hypothetical protein